MFEFDKPTVVGETGVSRYHEVASFITMHLNIEHHTFEHHAFKHHVFKHRTSCITMHSVITHVQIISIVHNCTYLGTTVMGSLIAFDVKWIRISITQCFLCTHTHTHTYIYIYIYRTQPRFFYMHMRVDRSSWVGENILYIHRGSIQSLSLAY